MNQFRFWAIALTNFLAIAKKILKLTGLLLLCAIVLSWSRPAQAASRLNPQLEEQVLQVIRAHPEVIIESVQAYQQQVQQQLQQAQQAFVQQIKTNTKAVIGESPTTGKANSTVLLVEFSDFQCPFCAQAHETVQQFMAKHQDEVNLVYKHYPLSSIHSQSLSAAKAAWAASQQGKFWEYHDALFTQQDQLSEPFYIATAKALNLDIEQFNSDRNSAAAEAAIQNDIQLAENLGIGGTPFFVMNGETFTGAIQLAEMEKILERVTES
ncbi:thioredoxin domain-containing protein [Coleofasciculus sp. LEGE 07092]|nr:thioredoxin domain-containing protein [Coleofasciculus sp. LEGE 07081]MBE9129588.1 thioredoxin domain-containing protein [Coleofasciculus sp. LEGE 07081]MBE9152141.1 thioredoxin domain-containing protein [Coleofasciculus sp. LEGE 07092]